MSNPFIYLQPSDFAQALRKLAPPGGVFPGFDATTQVATFTGLSQQEFVLHARSVTLLEVESDPASTVELLPDWEAEYGLPDPCTPLNPTIEQRRIALLGKIASVGGQSDAYLIGVAAAMGFGVTITHLRTSRAGILVAGGPLNGPNADYTMIVTASGIRLIWSVAGQMVAGDPIDFLDNTQLECRLRSIAPASDYLVFVYAN